MPAPLRSQEVELETMQSWDSSNPTLGSDLEGWLNYHTGDNRWYYWDGTNWIKLALDTNNVVTNANLRDSAALSVIGRSANSTGDPADIATTNLSGACLREDGGVLGFGQLATAGIANGSVTEAKLGAIVSGPAVLVASVAGTPEYKAPTNYPAYVLFKDASNAVQFPKISGTSFPTSPVDGQRFFHTTHRYSYVYDSAAGGWLSENTFEIDAGDTADTTSGTYLRMYAGNLSATRYSSTVGWKFNFAVKVIGMFALPAGAQANSCTVEVMDDGAAVTGASLSLAAADTQKYDEALMSNTIAALSIIGVRVSGTGPFEGPGAVKVRLRRFET